MLRRTLTGLMIYGYLSLAGDSAFAQQCRSTSQVDVLPSEKVQVVEQGKGVAIDFDHFPVGQIPAGFLPVVNGKGRDADWKIRPEPTAPSSPNVLAQVSMEAENFRFPLLVYTKFSAKNVEVSVQFKPVSGKIDQAAGLVIRYQDKDHFYVVRANALENNVRLYKAVDGIRQPISGANASVTTGKWHDIQLSVKDTHFRVCFDGMPLFEAEDETYQQAGQVGLSTKSDGVIAFDDLLIIDTDKP